MALDGTASRFLARRFGWAVAVVWATLTVCFVVVWSLPDTRMVLFTEVEMGLAASDVAGGETVFGSYLSWIQAFVTFDWGRSVVFEKPVVSVYAERLPVTLVYLVPQLLVTSFVGTWLTSYAATDRETWLHDLLSVVSVTGVSIPAFLLAWGLLLVMPAELGWTSVYTASLGLWHPQNLLRLQLPGAVVALSFLAVQIRHAQSETAEHLQLPFVKTARAKGAGRRRVTDHVFRNIWPSLVSLVLGEALGILVLSIIVVEEILQIPGIGIAMFEGFAAGDPMMTFTAVAGLVVVGVLGTLTKDIVRVLLDPRYDG